MIMQKTTREIKKIIIVTALIFIFIGVLCCFIGYNSFNSYDKVVKYVIDNKETLLTLAGKSLNHEEITNKPFRIKEISTYGENMVEFSVWSFTNQYSGFYYSKEDKPLAFQNVDAELLKEKENIWSWKENGDNGGKTIKIVDN